MLTILVLNKPQKKGEALAYSEDGGMCGGERTLMICSGSSEDVSGQMRSPFRKNTLISLFPNWDSAFKVTHRPSSVQIVSTLFNEDTP